MISNKPWYSLQYKANRILIFWLFIFIFGSLGAWLGLKWTLGIGAGIFLRMIWDWKERA